MWIVGWPLTIIDSQYVLLWIVLFPVSNCNSHLVVWLMRAWSKTPLLSNKIAMKERMNGHLAFAVLRSPERLNLLYKRVTLIARLRIGKSPNPLLGNKLGNKPANARTKNMYGSVTFDRQCDVEFSFLFSRSYESRVTFFPVHLMHYYYVDSEGYMAIAGELTWGGLCGVFVETPMGGVAYLYLPLKIMSAQ